MPEKTLPFLNWTDEQLYAEVERLRKLGIRSDGLPFSAPTLPDVRPSNVLMDEIRRRERKQRH